MKKLTLFILLSSFTKVYGQTLGPYNLYDRLVSATHPTACNPVYVTGWPEDSIWVNFNAGQVVTGTFGLTWPDQPGNDLLLETGFHASNYSVRLILVSGFSAVHNVALADWIFNMNVDWKYLFLGCGTGSITARQEYYLPLDFSADFGIGVGDVVTGIEITFLATGGAPDFAGAYIIVPAILPESVVQFTASPSAGNKVRMEWTVASQTEYVAFDVERSVNGYDWKSLKKIPASAGNNNDVHYTDWDDRPMPGTTWYRLGLTDMNGMFTFTDARKISLSQDDEPYIYPNPTLSGNINLVNFEPPFAYQLFDAMGNQVGEKRVSLNTEIDMQGLNPGIYFVRITKENISRNFKVGKE